MKEKLDLKLIASKIKDMIDMQIESDQGTLYRAGLKKWLPLMGDAYRESDLKPVRSHLGASLIGDDCDRKLFYSYRWVKPTYFSSRLLKLFNTGHRAEAEFISMLECIGVEVLQQTEDGKQYNFSVSNGHGGGSLDGILKNVPYLEDYVVTGEFKTSSDKLFKKMVKEGVERAKPQHLTQMVVGMQMFNADYCVYLCKNKDNDDLYVEIIEANKYAAGHFIERFDTIIFATTPPKRIADSPVAKECTFCDFVEICHRADYSNVDVNCRSCRWSYPSQHENEKSEWICGKHLCVIPKENAMFGCAKWEIREL
jgi:hypothetical protein